MQEWILICNNQYFDLKKAFKKNKTITWPQKEKISIGDYVYFYVTNPYRAILYKCVVETIELYHMDEDAKECVIHPLFYENKQVYMRLKLLKEYPEDLLTDEVIKENGVQNLQVTSKMPSDFSKYIIRKSKLVDKGKDESKNVKMILEALVVIISICIFMAAWGWHSSGKSPERGSTETSSKVDMKSARIKTDVTTISVGESIDVAFETEEYTYRNNDALSWTSSDKSIATVDEKGIVTGKATGTVTITGKLGEQEASIEIIVKEKDTKLTAQANNSNTIPASVESIEILCYSDLLLVGDSINTRLKADSWILDGSSESIMWQTDNEMIASIDDEGILTANSVGTCELIAEYGGKKISKKITVVEVDKKSGASVKADYEKISLSSYGDDTVVLNFSGNMPEQFGATAYYSEGISLKLVWGELKENAVPLTITDLYSIQEQGYVTILVYEKDNPKHVVATTKINVRIN